MNKDSTRVPPPVSELLLFQGIGRRVRRLCEVKQMSSSKKKIGWNAVQPKDRATRTFEWWIEGVPSPAGTLELDAVRISTRFFTTCAVSSFLYFSEKCLTPLQHSDFLWLNKTNNYLLAAKRYHKRFMHFKSCKKREYSSTNKRLSSDLSRSQTGQVFRLLWPLSALPEGTS